MQTPVESNGWRIEDADFVVIKDGLKPLIGKDLIDALEMSITQILCSHECSMVNTIIVHCPFKTQIANQFLHFISRIGRLKVRIVMNNFHKHFEPIKKVEQYH